MVIMHKLSRLSKWQFIFSRMQRQHKPCITALWKKKNKKKQPPSAELSCAELTGWGDRLSSRTVHFLVCVGQGVVLEVELCGLRQLLLHLFQHAGHGHGLEETLAHAGPGRYPADTMTTTKSAD